MMNKLFNKGVLNIFTDASVRSKGDGTFISCPGAIAVVTNSDDQYNGVIDCSYEVLDNATNNRGEMYGLYLGVLLAIKYKNSYSKINILSDSQISIYGISKWIFDWKDMNNSYINKSGVEVANQDIIKKIIHNILMYDLNVSFYHQKGHCLGNTSKSKSTFKRSNNIDLNDREAEVISYYNDMIDVFTGTKLNEVPINLNFKLNYLTNFDIGKYKQLIR